jgi:ribosomal protein S27E
MSAKMTCPGCQTTLQVRPEHAGKKIKCPRCGHIIPVPAAPAAPAPAVADPERQRQLAARRKLDPGAAPAKPPRPAPPPPRDAITEVAPEPEEAPRKRRRRDEDDEDEAPRRRKKARDEDDEDLKTEWKECPQCGAEGAKRVKWTAWGSFYGPAMFSHVRCPECGYCYNGRTGRSNVVPAIIFVTIPLLAIVGIVIFVFWMLNSRGYFG